MRHSGCCSKTARLVKFCSIKNSYNKTYHIARWFVDYDIFWQFEKAGAIIYLHCQESHIALTYTTVQYRYNITHLSLQTITCNNTPAYAHAREFRCARAIVF